MTDELHPAIDRAGLLAQADIQRATGAPMGGLPDLYGNLPPTQQLILEVLAARHRLGEGFWTFDTNVSAQLAKLDESGLIAVFHGNTPRTERASLTDLGRQIVMTETYLNPRDVLRQLMALVPEDYESPTLVARIGDDGRPEIVTPEEIAAAYFTELVSLARELRAAALASTAPRTELFNRFLAAVGGGNDD